MDGYLTDTEIYYKVIELVSHAKAKFSLPLGCSAEDACQRMGLGIQYTRLASDMDGLLIGNQVVVNSTITWTPRVQFTIFHELMHYLLDDDGELIEYFTEHLRGNQSAFQNAIERCCHQGAAEFLLPRRQVRTAIDSHGLSASLIKQLADHHEASIVASAIQVADCAPVPCYVTICSYGALPNYWPTTSGLFIEYAAASQSTKYPLARFTPIPEDHLFYGAWSDRHPAQGATFVPFRSGNRMPCNGEAICVGDRVAGLLMLRQPVSSAQLRLM